MLIIDNDENFLSIKELLKKREDSLLKNEKEIKNFLLLNNITNYHIKYDLSVTVWQDVVIKTKIDFLPVNFNETNCDFTIKNCGLKLLCGVPKKVNNFDCSHNELISLYGGPTNVNDYVCSHNQLTNIFYVPKSLNWFSCNHNKISTLLNAPEKATMLNCANNNITSLFGLEKMKCDKLDIRNNQITTLKYIPKLKVSLYAQQNKITSLKYTPKNLTNNCNFTDNLISSLKYLPKKIGNHLSLSFNPISEVDIKEIDIGGKLSFEGCNLKKIINIPDFEYAVINLRQNPDLGELQKILTTQSLKVALNKIEQYKELKNEFSIEPNTKHNKIKKI